LSVGDLFVDIEYQHSVHVRNMETEYTEGKNKPEKQLVVKEMY
jgi:hypothetical protein